MTSLTLYHYWRSSCSWRVRWALAWKGIKPHYIHLGLLDGEVEKEPHISKNPMGQVPVLEVNGIILIESVAIFEWLEETFPSPPLFPGDAFDRAHIRSLVEIINSGTQPIQNLNVLDYYSEDLIKRNLWSQFFICRGLKAYEKLANSHAGKFSIGNQVTAADMFLIPQLYNALRFEIDLTQFPLLSKIYNEALKTLEAKTTAPENFKPTTA